MKRVCQIGEKNVKDIFAQQTQKGHTELSEIRNNGIRIGKQVNHVSEHYTRTIFRCITYELLIPDDNTLISKHAVHHLHTFHIKTY